ncbi:MAG TPA: hypothetical protein VFH95_07190 [Candidatus Kapabacteria bacterium]|nr:hypothetical protein [Candidatus Kapabacteria bacterium]
MRSNPYPTYIDALDRTEPYPPFGEIRELVLKNENARKAIVPSFYRYAAGVVLLAVLAAGFGGYLLGNNSSPMARANTSSRAARVLSTSIPLKPIFFTPAISRSSLTFPRKSAGNEVRINDANSEAPSVQSKTHPTIALVNPITEVSNKEASYKTPSSLTAIRLNSTIPDPTSTENWSVFVAGGTAPSGMAANGSLWNSLLDAAGVRYNVSKNSSLVFALRQTSFREPHSGQNNTLRDTMLTAGGQMYRATIGGTSPTTTQETAQVFSLDLGYRFELFPDAELSPCAEVLAGASASGFLTSEAAGIQYRFWNPFTLDLSARAVQLYSRSSPMNTMELESAIGFAW